MHRRDRLCMPNSNRHHEDCRRTLDHHRPIYAAVHVQYTDAERRKSPRGRLISLISFDPAHTIHRYRRRYILACMLTQRVTEGAMDAGPRLT